MTTPAHNQLVVLGGGLSGLGAARLGKRQGWRVFLSDAGGIQAEPAAKLAQEHIEFEFGQHSSERILKADLLVKSPGIPPWAPILEEVHAHGIPVISEIEFASRYCPGQIIAITGTNGKTTTTRMIAEIMERDGFSVRMGGNIGRSFAELLVDEAPAAWYVIEVSSFQLEDIETFRPHIAVITNLAPNHLDRYGGSMARYGAAKLRITENQTSEDDLVVNLDSPDLMSTLARAEPPIRARQLGFSLDEKPGANAFFQESNLILIMANRNSTKPRKFRLPMEQQQNLPNRYNSMASAITGDLVNARKEAVRDSLQQFQNSPHRLEELQTLRERKFVNDSKATNVNATWFALQNTPGPVVWIVGGVDKGNDYGMLLTLVKSKVSGIVALGKDTAKIREAFEGEVDCMEQATGMQEAVQKAYNLSKEGDTILLSPACASFDLFQNYEERGRRFKQVVEHLASA